MSQSSLGAEAQGQSKPYATWWILLLGVVTAVGPLTIDMYLPALPAIGEDFGVSTAVASHSVTAYFVGLILGQLIYGPLSDRVGRRTPLIGGFVLYIVASVLCALAPNPESLIVTRFLQALGGCAGVVIARAAIRDRLSGRTMSEAISMLILVMGVAPVVAPMLGNLLLPITGWRGIFVFLAVFALGCTLWSAKCFDDTLPAEKRSKEPWSRVGRQYAELCKDASFLIPALASGALMGALFVYIGTSAELLMDYFGLTSTQYSWVFGANAAGLIGMTQLSARLVRRFRVVTVFRAGAWLQCFASLLLVAAAAFGVHQAWIVYPLIFFTLAGIGLTAPNGTTLALAKQADRSGLASSMLGGLQFLIGVLGSVALHSVSGDLFLRFSLALALMMAVGLAMSMRIKNVALN